MCFGEEKGEHVEEMINRELFPLKRIANWTESTVGVQFRWISGFSEQPFGSIRQGIEFLLEDPDQFVIFNSPDGNTLRVEALPFFALQVFIEIKAPAGDAECKAAQLL